MIKSTKYKELFRRFIKNSQPPKPEAAIFKVHWVKGMKNTSVGFFEKYYMKIVNRAATTFYIFYIIHSYLRL